MSKSDLIYSRGLLHQSAGLRQCISCISRALDRASIITGGQRALEYGLDPANAGWRGEASPGFGAPAKATRAHYEWIVPVGVDLKHRLLGYESKSGTTRGDSRLLSAVF